MRELGLTGLSEDGRFLVAHDSLTDESFHIPTDIRLTSLLETSPSGTRESTMESTLSPRDIQARIRRGNSPQQVADESGMPLDKIQAFAVPVIAEREFVVEQARKTSVRRLHVSGSAGMLLGSLVDESVAARGLSPEAARWDSWRREDGRWTIVVLPEETSEPATFLFDTKGRYVLPADDIAHELIGDLALQESPEVVETHDVEPEELTIEVDIVEEIIEADITFDLPVPEDFIEHSAQVSSLKEARDRRALEQLALTIDAEAAAPTEASDVEITEEHDLAVPHTAKPAKKKHERRRVPSWDEIMFGGRHD